MKNKIDKLDNMAVIPKDRHRELLHLESLVLRWFEQYKDLKKGV